MGEEFWPQLMAYLPWTRKRCLWFSGCCWLSAFREEKLFNRFIIFFGTPGERVGEGEPDRECEGKRESERPQHVIVVHTNWSGFRVMGLDRGLAAAGGKRNATLEHRKRTDRRAASACQIPHNCRQKSTVHSKKKQYYKGNKIFLRPFWKVVEVLKRLTKSYSILNKFDLQFKRSLWKTHSLIDPLSSCISIFQRFLVLLILKIL